MLNDLLNKKAHFSNEATLIRHEIQELKEELRYKQHLIREINTDLLKMNGKKSGLRLVYSSNAPVINNEK